MISKATIAAIASTTFMLSGCLWIQDPFYATAAAPDEATEVKSISVDLDNDGSPENILSYTVTTPSEFDQPTIYQRLEVYDYVDGVWKLNIEEPFVNTNQGVNRFLGHYEKIDLNGDGIEEVYVPWHLERPLPNVGSYFVIGSKDGNIRAIDIPKVEVSSLLNIDAGETELAIYQITPSTSGITEKFSVYCEAQIADKPIADRYSESCRQFEALVTYDNGVLTRSLVEQETI